MPDNYYKPVGHKDYGKMGPYNKKKKDLGTSEGPFGTIRKTRKPVVNDMQVVKKKKRG
jgi:hypothetical protein